MFITKVIFSADNPVVRSRLLRPLFVVVAVATCALFIFILGPAFLLITPVWFAIVVSVLIGMACTVFLLLYVVRYMLVVLVYSCNFHRSKDAKCLDHVGCWVLNAYMYKPMYF